MPGPRPGWARAQLRHWFIRVPLAVNKEQGPTTCLTFLGIEIDSVTAQLRLPSDKLQRLLSTLALWGDKKVCLCRELESLIGSLNRACKVVRGQAVCF